ncbi:MAG: hypothetical protein KAS90_02070, partial [Candidatus Aenigmarchaeota archaeon]|nr:hypothetical protein [Candidatus Aenigmarchaeota archaeon]
MEYKRLADVYSKLESTTLKLEKTDIVARFLETVDKDELEIVVLLITGRVYPGWSSQELGMSSGLMVKGLARAYEGKLTKGIRKIDVKKIDEIENEWKKLGDLGLVTEKYFLKNLKKGQSKLFAMKNVKQKKGGKPKLTVQKVFDDLRKIAGMEGMKSQDKKLNLVSDLLSSVSNPLEARYIARTVIGDLRIGVAEGLLRDAIASAFFANVFWKETLEQKVNGDIRLKVLSRSVTGKKILVDEKLATVLEKKHDEAYDMLKSGNDVVVRQIKKVSDDELLKKE